MTPAHAGVRYRRWAVLVLVLAVVIGGAALTRTKVTVLAGGPPVSPGVSVTAPDAESSAWYCTGQSTVSGQIDPGSVVLTNTGTRPVSGEIAAVTDTGAAVHEAVVVAAHSEMVAPAPQPSSGTWLSYSVVLAGGGVAVSQFVHGASGWAEAPCQSTTSQDWYFPSGVTSGSDSLFVALFNPTSTPVVVDMSFVTPSGVEHPINFEGLVLQPGQTQVQNVSSYVQEQPRVAAAVTARTGRVVASELQLLSGTSSGLALVPGAPQVEKQWTIPEGLEVAGGTSTIDIFNPGPVTEDVTVRTRIGSGALAPFEQHVLPGTTWSLPTSAQTRIPHGDAYAAVIDATGGPGVVVGRTVAAPGPAQAPQAGMADGVDSLSAASPSDTWVVPAPGTPAAPVVSGVLPAHLGLANSTGRSERYVVEVMLPGGRRTIASGTLAPSGFITLGQSILFGAGLNPLLVTSTGPMAVSQDVGPTGTLGVVTMPGIQIDGSPGG